MARRNNLLSEEVFQGWMNHARGFFGGRLTGTTTQYTFLTRSLTTSYAYDKASNRTGFADPESGSTTYAYDTLNRLQTLTPPAAYGKGNFGFSYDALSQRAQMTRPNSVSSTYAY